MKFANHLKKFPFNATGHLLGSNSARMNDQYVDLILCDKKYYLQKKKKKKKYYLLNSSAHDGE